MIRRKLNWSKDLDVLGESWRNALKISSTFQSMYVTNCLSTFYVLAVDKYIHSIIILKVGMLMLFF